MRREFFLALVMTGSLVAPAFADIIPEGVDPRTYKRKGPSAFEQWQQRQAAEIKKRQQEAKKAQSRAKVAGPQAIQKAAAKDLPKAKKTKETPAPKVAGAPAGPPPAAKSTK